MSQVHGGRLIAQALRRQEVEYAFTLCGGHVQAIYDGCVDENVRIVDTRHEQTAGFAADGYARLTGKPGVVIVTAGPGVSNVVTALLTAQRASVPLVCIGGAAPRGLTDMGALQDLDSVQLMRPACKWAARIPEARRAKEYVYRAFHVARAGVPGPVYLEAPLDVLMEVSSDEEPLNLPPSPVRPGLDPDALRKASELLAAAERPCFVVGSQLRWSQRPNVLDDAIVRMAAPFYLNGQARGAVGSTHPALFSASRRHALSRSDLIVVLGTPVDFRLGYGRTPAWNADARVIQVDLDAERLGYNRAADVAMQADVGVFLEALAQERSHTERSSGPWLTELREIEDEQLERTRAQMASRQSPPTSLRVCGELARRLGPADVVVGDGGAFVAAAAQCIELQWPQVWMDPGPMGTLGVGPGFALAASLVRPNSRVAILFGDGAFGLSGMEFEALSRHGCNVVAVVGNDASSSQTRRAQIQLYGEERAVATQLEHTRYDEVVQALGGKGYWVERCEELGPALDGAFAAAVPSCVNVRIADAAAPQSRDAPSHAPTES